MEISLKLPSLIIGIVLIALLSSTSAMKRSLVFLSRCMYRHHCQRYLSTECFSPIIQTSLATQAGFQHHSISTNQISKYVKTDYRRPFSFSSWPLHVTKKKKSTLTYEDVMNMEDGQLDPMSVVNGTLPMPKALSPSAAAEFKNCPQSFFFQYILSIKQPPSLALAKGSMCHSALEQIFDLEPRQRTLPHLQNLFRQNWSKVRLSDNYGPLFEKAKSEFEHERDIDAERKWGTEALTLLENYYQLEDPRLIPRPNPLEREIWVTAHLSLDPSKGATGDNSINNANSSVDETFYVRGIVDRLDYVAVPPSPHDASQDGQMGAVRIVDYKTGKAPHFKYSPTTNQRIAEDNLWQLKIYALLLIEMIKKNKAYSKSGNLQKICTEDIRLLRLMYLTSVDGDARYLDMDLGSTQDERNKVLQEIHEDLSEIWKSITHSVSLQDPTAFQHCDRPWCYCHKIRPKFISDTLNQ